MAASDESASPDSRVRRCIGFPFELLVALLARYVQVQLLVDSQPQRQTGPPVVWRIAAPRRPRRSAALQRKCFAFFAMTAGLEPLVSGLSIAMAGDDPVLHTRQRRLLLPADWHRMRTARMEPATRGRIQR